jgi:hypothetical protein
MQWEQRMATFHSWTGLQVYTGMRRGFAKKLRDSIHTLTKTAKMFKFFIPSDPISPKLLRNFYDHCTEGQGASIA